MTTEKDDVAQKSARRGLRTDPDVRKAIEDLARLGHTGAAIERQLHREESFPGRVPSLRTIQSIIRPIQARRPTKPGETWQFDDPESGAAVLPVLAEVLERTEGRISAISRDEAEWIVKLRRAFPDLPPWDSFHLAQLYVAGPDEIPPGVLDEYLAFTPWRDAGARYSEAHRRGLTRAIWIPGTEHARRAGFPDWTPEMIEEEADNGRVD